MQEQKEQHIEFLESLNDDALPEVFERLSVPELQELHTWVSKVLAKEQAGLDKLFESMSQTFKYIPNFLLIAITKKYIEAPIAARITAKLSLKQAITIASGLSAEFVGETAVYLECEFAAELLGALPKKQASNIVAYLFQYHPLKALDVFTYASDNLFRLAKPPKELLSMNSVGMSDLRCEVLSRLS